MSSILTRFVNGNLRIEIRGEYAEKFLNLSLMQGIGLSNVVRYDERRIAADIILADIYRLRPIARASHCRFIIKRRQGLPFILERCRRRKLLLIGAVAFCVFLYLASSLVLSLTVTSPYSLSQSEKARIVALAREAGVIEGKLKYTMDLEAAQEHISQELPQLSFVEVSIIGNNVIINVVKRVDVSEEDKIIACGDIVATKDGVIEQILVRKGTACVKAGDTVTAGTVLVRGYNQSGLVAASAIVSAHVWYSGYGECALENTVVKNTGEQYMTVELSWPKQIKAYIWGDNTPEFQYYYQHQKSMPLVIWRNIRLPVELVITYYQEQQQNIISFTPEQAWQQAAKKAEKNARIALAAGAQIVSSDLKEIDAGDSIKRARFTIETIEDIGDFVKVDEQTQQQYQSLLNNDNNSTE